MAASRRRVAAGRESEAAKARARAMWKAHDEKQISIALARQQAVNVQQARDHLKTAKVAAWPTRFHPLISGRRFTSEEGRYCVRT